MNHARVIHLNGLVMPEDGGLLRDHVRKPERQTANNLDKFDRTTVFYDCVRLPDRGSYLFTAPRMLNFWPLVRDGLRIDGERPQRLRRRKWLRCEQIEAFAPEGPISVTLDGTPYDIPSRETQSPHFTGSNALLAVNKNNTLNWIADWAEYYVRAHGCNAVVLFDNGSTDYAPDDIADRLSRVAGLSQTTVFSAPFPYGPTARSNRLEISPRFFQTSMLNIARRDALSSARAVCSVDIDEIARSHSGASVFDLAVKNRVGMVTINGSWIYPAPESEGPSDHGAHAFRRVPDRPCNRKWCLTPDGLMSKFGWAVHHIGGPLQDLFTNQSDVTLLHCHGTSTGWKKKRFARTQETEQDDDVAQFMASNFPHRT